jgi:LEA14-like dessication related protein
MWDGMAAVRAFAARIMALVVVIALAVSGCAALRRAAVYPTARVESVELADIGLDAATIEFTLGVENPYSVSLPVGGLDFVLSIEEQKFLEGSADLDRAIPAHETGRLAVPVRVPFVKIYEIASDVQLGSTIGYHADLGLRVSTPVAGEISLPLDADGEIELPGR